MVANKVHDQAFGKRFRLGALFNDLPVQENVFNLPMINFALSFAAASMTPNNHSSRLNRLPDFVMLNIHLAKIIL